MEKTKGNIEEKEQKEVKKAYFIQRLIAFLLDMFIVSFVASLITTPFINLDKSEELEKKAFDVIEKLQNQEVDYNEYTNQYMTIYYKLAKLTGVETFVTLLLSVLYFVVYQLKAGGQTLGKKLMKIKVVSKDGELSYNQMIFRTFISNFILINLITFVFMIFSSKDMYFYVSGIFTIIQYVIVVISIIMVMNRKNGEAIHDKIAHTMVIKEN